MSNLPTWYKQKDCKMSVTALTQINIIMLREMYIQEWLSENNRLYDLLIPQKNSI